MSDMEKIARDIREGRFPKKKEDEITRFEIAKLELRKGDTLIVKTDLHLTRDQAIQLRDHVQKFAPDGIQVLVLTSGVSLEVLRDER